MYSMVLMAALTTTPDAAAFGNGCFGGCGGCTGTVVAVGCSGCSGTTSCFGSCYGSCYGSSCYSSSCCGGSGVLFPRLRARRSNFLGGGSCCGGSCYSSSCCGGSCFSSSCCGGSCYSSSCYGSSSYTVVRSSGGCYGSSCFGSCHGAVVAAPVLATGGCYGGVGMGLPVYTPAPAFGGCHGGGAVYYGPDFRSGGVVPPPVVGSGIIDGLGSNVPTLTIDRSSEHRAAQSQPQAAPARLTVELPATARLYVDGNLVKGDSASRNFHTPDLPVGKTFYYDLKAEIAVNGRMVTEEKRVVVKAGDVATEAFEKLIAAAGTDDDKTSVAKK